MTDDKNTRFNLTRRKALASMGVTGAAIGLGGIGTFAQFTDTEDATVTFTAGGIDGSLAYCATHNTQETATEPAVVSQSDGLTNGVGVQFAIEDVKPGDYGSISFELEVSNNAAWVASCLGISEDSDHVSFEPEREVEGADEGDDPDIYESQGSGELAENFLLIPYYADEICATFFDNGWPNEDYGPQQDDENNDGAPEFGDISVQESDLSTSAVGTLEGFWNSREGENDWGNLRPLTIREAVGNPLSLSTVYWHDDEQNVVEAPAGAEVGNGCVFLDGGALNDESTNNDDREATPLQPGDNLVFGYDWHIPFGVENEVQGDRLVLDMGFTFAQTRHTAAPELANIYQPGSQPADGA